MPRCSSTVSVNDQTLLPVRSFQLSLPHVSWPSFAGARNGVKVPHLLAGARVVGVHVALLALARREVRSDVPFAGPEEIGSHQDDVPVDHRHAGVRDFQIDVTAVAELDVERAGVGAQRDQLSQAREEDARQGSAIAGPIRDTAERCESFGQFVAPDFLAGLGFERDDAIARWQIHHAIHHDGRDLLKHFERAGRLVDRGHGPPGSGRSRYDHAWVSVETFVVLICVSGE